DTALTEEDTSVIVAVLSNDSDSDGDSLTVTGVVNPANGTVVVNGDKTITYTPDGDYYGTDSFTYTVSDGKGGTDTAAVTITVNAVNDPPVAVADSYATMENTVLTITAPGVLGNDSDADSIGLTASVVSGPANGELTLNTDGSFSYMPAAGFFGSDTFQYAVNDGAGGSAEAAVTIIVHPAVAELKVTGITPNTMKLGTTVGVEVAGTGFVEGSILSFENGDGPAPEASSITISPDGTTITASVYAKAGGPSKPRYWDVRVTNPDGTTFVLPDGFTVLP
ncbi:MAG: tandem-95 repeat protein, partial [Sedimentisphaerales bacterium]|nr:tandem-95 repeat protein [Sedimentisphaerales bacterium]